MVRLPLRRFLEVIERRRRSFPVHDLASEIGLHPLHIGVVAEIYAARHREPLEASQFNILPAIVFGQQDRVPLRELSAL